MIAKRASENNLHIQRLQLNRNIFRNPPPRVVCLVLYYYVLTRVHWYKCERKREEERKKETERSYNQSLDKFYCKYMVNNLELARKVVRTLIRSSREFQLSRSGCDKYGELLQLEFTSKVSNTYRRINLTVTVESPCCWCTRETADQS